jgi:NADPH-dependent 2,4-dienoyl-CoA reductase/sulfur reductase-like enzyme
MGRKILVVGGVAAGASAAVKARRTDENAAILCQLWYSILS